MASGKNVTKSQTDADIFTGQHSWEIKEYRLRAKMEDQIESPIFGIEKKNAEGKTRTINFQLQLGAPDQKKITTASLKCLSRGEYVVRSSIGAGTGDKPENLGSLTEKFDSLKNTWSYAVTKELSSTTWNLVLVCDLYVLARKGQEILEVPVQGTLPTLGVQLATALGSSDFSNVKIRCREKTFTCHKAVLVARSEVFKAMLGVSETKESETGEVDIVDMEPEDVGQLLRFLYTDDVDHEVMNPSKLLAAAEKYNLSKLKSICGDLLADRLCAENAVEVLKLSFCYGPEQLKECSVAFIASNISKVAQAPDWEEIKTCPEGILAVLMCRDKI